MPTQKSQLKQLVGKHVLIAEPGHPFEGHTGTVISCSSGLLNIRLEIYITTPELNQIVQAIIVQPMLF